MIKRFISSGIIGVPDCDIVFNDSKMILIQGPNGSGKSSLLKYVTHPFRSLNGRSVALKTNALEGKIESHYVYNGNEYIVRHTIERKNGKSKKLENKSYLIKKVGNDFVHLVDDGSVSKFAAEIEREFQFTPSMYNILNIGVNNFGMVNMTNADRLLLVKNLLRMDMLDELTDVLSSKTSEAKTLYDNYSKEVDNIGDYPSLIGERDRKISDKKTLIIEKSNLNRHLLLSVDKDKIEDLVNVIKGIESDINDINKIESIEDLIGSNQDYTSSKEYYSTLYIESKSSYNHIKDQLIQIIHEISESNSLDRESLDKEKSGIEQELSTITDFKKVDFDINECINYLNNTVNMCKDYDVSIIIEGCDNYEKFINKCKSIKKHNDDLNNSIHDLQKLMEEETYQENIVSLIPHEKTPKECPLYIEWDRQIKNKDTHIKYMEQYKLLKESLESHNELMETYKTSLQIVRNIIGINKPNVFNEIFKDYSYLQGDYKANAILNNLTELDFKNKEYRRKTQLETRLQDINNNITILEQRALKQISSLESKKVQKEKELVEVENEMKKYENIIKRFDIKVNNMNLFSLPMDSLMITKRNLIEDIKEKEKSLEDYKRQLDKNMRINDSIKNIDDQLMKLSADISLLDYKIKEYESKIDSKEKYAKDWSVLKNLREIVKTHLTTRMVEPYLRKIERIVNNLLGDFMSLRFDDLDTGKLEMICIRDGIDRSANNLSSGEMSMLSIALLMAMKVDINWDIISIDEGSSMLDEYNKERFIYMLRDYSTTIPNISQLFIVSHDNVILDGMDIFNIKITDEGILH